MFKSPKLFKKKSAEVKSPGKALASSASAKVIEDTLDKNDALPPQKANAVEGEKVPNAAVAAVAKKPAVVDGKKPTKKLESLQALRYITAVQVGLL